MVLENLNVEYVQYNTANDNLKINVYFVVEDNDDYKRRDILDSAGEQCVPYPVLRAE